MPFPDLLAPKPSVSRECGDPGAGVLAALGVVGRGRQHRPWRPRQPLGVRGVELRDADGGMAGTGADLVAGDQPVEAIERGVFEALGHDRSGELLRPQDELQALLAAGR